MTEILRQLGRYELLRRIAAGGMGEIFLAKMRGTGGFEKRIIIKTILPHLAEEEEFITKFLDEGRLVVQLIHGNIVPVFDMGEEDGEHFLAMEYIPGRDLREVIKRLQLEGKTMPMELALFIISEVCKGLDYAHRKADDLGAPMELVHRDVSPSNILLSHEGEIKIIDFGIARATNKLSRTVSGRIQGKFCYMSPEQASGKIVDARSDIFSTGVVLYELLTGMRPFEGRTDLESIDLVRKCECDPPSTLNALIPPEVDEIMARAMALELDARYTTIGQMQTDLLHFLYSNACAPTGPQVAEFMDSLFPEGIERRELRSATTSRSRDVAPAPMSLDDILDQELGLLMDHPVDPHTSTAPSLSAAPVPQHTATLQADVPLAQPTLHPPTPRPISDVATPPGDILESAPGNAAQSAPGLVESSEELTPSQAEPLATFTQETPARRGVIAAGIGGVVLLTLAIVASFVFGNQRGEVLIQSEPAGARIFVDDALVSGATTPYTIALEPGTHTFRLERQGYEKTERLRLDVLAHRTHVLEGGEIPLRPRASAAKARRVLVSSQPPGAMLSLDGKELGISPQAVELAQDVRVIYARRKGCQDQSYLITRNFEQDALTISLECEAPSQSSPSQSSPPQTTPKSQTSTQAERPKKLTVTLRARPEDAIITIDDARDFKGVFSGRFSPEESFKVRVFKPGYKPIERVITPGKLRSPTITYTLEPQEMGCLNARVFRPQVASVSIDGELVGAKVSLLDAHPLTSGTHTVHAVNELAGRDERYKVTITPGDSCAQLTIFPAE